MRFMRSHCDFYRRSEATEIRPTDCETDSIFYLLPSGRWNLFSPAVPPSAALSIRIEFPLSVKIIKYYRSFERRFTSDDTKSEEARRRRNVCYFEMHHGMRFGDVCGGSERNERQLVSWYKFLYVEQGAYVRTALTANAV